MKCAYTLLLLLSLALASCSDKKDEPVTDEDKLIGYWAITHIQAIEHIGNNHSSFDKDIPPHGLEGYAGENEADYRYDVLIFDGDLVTVRGDMPSRPKQSHYDDTSDGMTEYNNDLQRWEDSIGTLTDLFACPVGTYSIKENNLIIGSLNMGTIKFMCNNEFTLDYKMSTNDSGDYLRYIYTYTRIYSLKL